ncbi:MAG TPA: YtxH domain-containing protein [Candidatus Sumerlaeota bacterium]|nr:YtxH domain-containing protein [Candidatus Sumerlaeota bacterium]HPS02251.1 YtxH domain-containing protein [Candidatus Sumerlaeota bacterium]
MSENCSYHVDGCLLAFAAGTLIGAGIALIYAPHSGKETRDLLARRTHEAKDKVEGALEAAKEKVGCVLHDAKEAIHEKGTEIAAAVTAGREAMREQKETPSEPPE